FFAHLSKAPNPNEEEAEKMQGVLVWLRQPAGTIIKKQQKTHHPVQLFSDKVCYDKR
ncbi:unnamed protein product, partial [marine sediment metagenome]